MASKAYISIPGAEVSRPDSVIEQVLRFQVEFELQLSNGSKASTKIGGIQNDLAVRDSKWLFAMTSVPVRPVYGKPFGGRWKPLELSGLFLFNPEVDFKLLGTSLRGLMEKAGHASLLSGLRRIFRLGIQATRRLKDEMLSLFPLSSFRRDLAAALDGDQDAQSRLEAIGLWEALALGTDVAAPGRPRTYVLDFVVEIERASAAPSALVRSGHCAEAAALLSNDVVLAAFLWPRALDLLARCTEPRFLVAWQVSVAMEVRLSILAALNVERCTSFSQPSYPIGLLSVLMPVPEVAGSTPLTQLFQWLMEAMTATTVPQLQEKLDLKGVSVDPATLYRWKSGSHQPEQQLADKVADALPTEKKGQFLALNAGCRHLYLMGFMAQVLCEEARKRAGHPAAETVAPWPEFPFGYGSFETWCAGRYPVWLDFHRRRLAQRGLREAA